MSVAEQSTRTIANLTRPRWGIRIGTALLISLIAVVTFLALRALQWPDSLTNMTSFVQTLESAINDVVFVGLAIAFLVTIEGRLRRREALAALHELRSLVHIVDMHQLTKDPEPLSLGQPPPLPPPELARYLDNCSELLSVSSKVAALYAQRIQDPVVLVAVNEIEALTTGLSSKIWQKLVILGTAARPAG